MRRGDDRPTPLGDLLAGVAARLRRVDLRLVDEVRRRWPDVVDPVIAEHCRPDFVKDGELVVRVPSGAFAQRINSESAAILAAFADLGASAPRTLRIVVGDD